MWDLKHVSEITIDEIKQSKRSISKEIVTAFSAAGSEQYLKIAFAVFAAFKLVENPVRKHSEALSASKIDKLSMSKAFVSIILMCCKTRNR